MGDLRLQRNAPAALTMLAAPDKLNYVAGDKLNLTGVKLQITYSNRKSIAGYYRG